MNIIYTKAITKDVSKIKDKNLIARIESVLEAIKSATHIENLKSLKKMSGHPTAYRIRIGDYRLGLYYEGETVILARFLKRSDIYKVFPKK